MDKIEVLRDAYKERTDTTRNKKIGQLLEVAAQAKALLNDLDAQNIGFRGMSSGRALFKAIIEFEGKR